MPTPSVTRQFQTLSETHFSAKCPSSLKIFPLLATVIVLGYSPAVLAQAGPDAGALQQQLQREAERERSAVKPEKRVKPKKKADPAQAVSKTIDIKSFQVVGMTLVEQAQAQEVLKPYNNRQLTLDQIKEAAAAVTNLYTQMGRVAQAVVPPQDVVKGVITIKIIEGKVGDVLIELDKARPSRLKSSVSKKVITAKNAPGKLIDLNGLERSLALLNEIPGTQVTGELTQGDRDETTNIVVNAKDTGLFAGRVDLTNYGAANTGSAQAVASLSLNDLSGYGDQATLDVLGSQGSVYGQLRYGMPVGYDGWRVSGGVSALDYKTLSSFSTPAQRSQGTAQTYGIYSQYALERTGTSSKNITINFENKNYINQTAGVESSKYQLNNLAAGINGSNYLQNAYVSWGSTLTLGSLSINNSTQASNDAQNAATEGSFAKLGFNGSITQPLPIKRTNLVASLYGQLANKNLNSAEQLYLGGPYGVRAYPVAQGGGSQGAVASIEINHTVIQNLQLGAFFDAGMIQQYVDTYKDWQGPTNASNTYSLYATGLSAKYQYQRIQLSGSLAWRLGNNPLYTQSGQQLNSDNQYRDVQGWIKGSIFF